MWLSSLKSYQFRNGASLIDGPFSLFNGIFGPNTRGKTNFIEAIYYIAHLKSWRATHKRDLIQTGFDEASLKAGFESREQVHEILVRLFPNKREVVVDGKLIRSWANYQCPFVAVLFVPEDAYLFRETPEKRRHTLDQMLYHQDAAYWRLLRAYRHVIDCKNALLKDDRTDTLSTWNEQLVMYASDSLERRFNYLNALLPIFQDYYSRIVRGQGARERLSIAYFFSGEAIELNRVISKSEWEDRLREALKKNAAREARQRQSVVGPHRDDWALYLDGQAVASTASQGEHRSLVMALKLAEVSLLQDHFGEAPIFLVDDLSSELDQYRRRFLIETLLDTRCQTFLTSTDPGPFVDVLPKEQSRMFML